MKVLVLRPEPGASETLRKARERGLEAVAAPLFEINPVEWDAPDPSNFDAILFTSANAVRFGGDAIQGLAGLKVYAVGERTAAAADEAGLTVAGVGEGGVEQLLDSLPSRLRLLNLCGADRKTVAASGQMITPIVVYRATPIEAPDLSAAPGSVALIHSPRAGRRFAELVRDRSSIAVAAISPAAADTVGKGWRKVESIDCPTDDALLALAARLCNNPPPK